MRAVMPPRRARFAASVLALAAALLASTAAQADDPAPLRREAADLQETNVALAAREQAALLELYALETRLAHAADRVAALRARAVRIDREQETTRRLLNAARLAYDEAQRRLGARVRALYVEGESDPLAVLLGSESLDDVITALDSLDRIAEQDNNMVEQARRARLRLRVSLAELARREAELRLVTVQARQAHAGLRYALSERRSALSRIASDRQLNEGEIAALLSRAEHAEARSEELSASGPAAGSAPPSEADTAAVSGRSQIEPPKTVAGAQITVVATAYALPGTTATGLPVGPGIVAVDPDFIPLGTRMAIPGYGEGIAADTGGSIAGNRIDVWVPSEDDAVHWGWRTIVITII